MGPGPGQGCGRPVSLLLSSAGAISFIGSVVFRPCAGLWTVNESSGTHPYKSAGTKGKSTRRGVQQPLGPPFPCPTEDPWGPAVRGQAGKTNNPGGWRQMGAGGEPGVSKPTPEGQGLAWHHVVHQARAGLEPRALQLVLQGTCVPTGCWTL